MGYTENFAAGVFAYLIKLNLICKIAHMPLKECCSIAYMLMLMHVNLLIMCMHSLHYFAIAFTGITICSSETASKPLMTYLKSTDNVHALFL